MRLAATLAIGLLVAPLAAQGFGPDLLDPPVSFEGLSEMTAPLLRDLTGDGVLDLVGGDSNYALTFRAGTGHGDFGSLVSVPMGGSLFFPQFETVDLDLDGWADVECLGVQYLVVRRGLGGESFAPVSETPLPINSQSSNFAVGDINGDGRPDVLASRIVSGGGRIIAAKGHGDGSFSPFADIATTRTPVDLQLADVDLDGDLDVLDVDVMQDGFLPLDAAFVTQLNDGAGGLIAAPSPVPLPVFSHADRAGDHDLDGFPDVLSWDQSTGALQELVGHGDGSFAPLPLFQVGVPIRQAHAADFDHDGSIDVAALRPSYAGQPPEIVIQRLVRLAPEGEAFSLHPPDGSQSMATADLDGNGLVDLVVSYETPPQLPTASVVAVYANALGPVADLGLGSLGGPTLSVTGVVAPGQTLTLQLTAAGHAPALLVAATQAAPQVFGGALLIPKLQGLLSLSAPAKLSGTLPADLPAGTLIYLQALIPNGSGLASSNAVMLVPEP